MRLLYLLLFCCLIFALTGLQPEHLLAGQPAIQSPLALPLQPNQQMMQVPTQPELEDIAGPVFIEEPFPIISVVAGIGIFLIILLLLFLLYKKMKKKNPEQISPAARALKQLDQHRENLAKEKNDRVYLTRVADSLGSYIENRFQLQSASKTSEEFLATISRPSASSFESDSRLQQYRGQLRDWLALLDKTKFAHKPVSNDDLVRLDQEIRSFIQKTAQEKEEG